MYEFIDKVRVFVSAGNGGSGAVCFSRDRKRTPSGGSGGKGGNIIVYVDYNLSFLNSFKGVSHFFAEPGISGSYNNMAGKNADDYIINIPIGTVVTDDNGDFLFKAVEYGQTYIVAKGGIGGIGNGVLMSSVRQYINYSQPATPGEQKWITLQLEYPADISILGSAASGKSLFLKSVTKVKIPEGVHGFKHDMPIIATADKLRFIELPSSDKKDYFQHIKHSNSLLIFLTVEYASKQLYQIVELLLKTKQLNQLIFVIGKSDIISRAEKKIIRNILNKTFMNYNLFLLSNKHEKSIQSLKSKISK